MDLSKLDLGPYEDADAARTALQVGVTDPALIDNPTHLRLRAQVVVDSALCSAGMPDLPTYESDTIRAIAAHLAPEQAQVIAGWIRRAYNAGQEVIVTTLPPREPSA